MTESEYLILIGKRIKSLRKHSKLTQKELAKAAECSHSLISHAERGRTKLDIEKYRSIAAALGVPVSVLLTEKTLTNEQLFALANFSRILTADKPTPNLGAIKQLIESDAKTLNGLKK
jgi:transcriptional regulator with XRE-family HTH domain